MIAMVAAAVVAPAQAAEPARAAIEAALAASGAGWNAGDLDRFVAVYAPDATFVTSKGLVSGRAAIAEHYRPSFVGGGNARGQLGFRTLGYRTLSAVHAILWARWRLTPADPAKAPETGVTTLLFERRTEGWRIISDHSS